MTMIQNILFPVDFSPSCIAMAAYVKRSAAIFSAKVAGYRGHMRSNPSVRVNGAPTAKDPNKTCQQRSARTGLVKLANLWAIDAERRLPGWQVVTWKSGFVTHVIFFWALSMSIGETGRHC
jgi:hypothetical protein